MKKKNKKPCFKDIYKPYKWALFITLTIQLLFSGFMTLGIYAEQMYIALPLTLAVLIIAARMGRNKRAVCTVVRAIAALPVAFGVVMVLFQTAASAASEWQLSFGTILWDAVRSTLPMMPWLMPVYGVVAYSRTRYDRVALCVAQGYTAALAIITVVLSYLPNSGILIDNDWGIPHIAALYALAGVGVAALAVTLVYSLARPERRTVAEDDDTDTFDGLLQELQEKQ